MEYYESIFCNGGFLRTKTDLSSNWRQKLLREREIPLPQNLALSSFIITTVIFSCHLIKNHITLIDPFKGIRQWRGMCVMYLKRLPKVEILYYHFEMNNSYYFHSEESNLNAPRRFWRCFQVLALTVLLNFQHKPLFWCKRTRFKTHTTLCDCRPFLYLIA